MQPLKYRININHILIKLQMCEHDGCFLPTWLDMKSTKRHFLTTAQTRKLKEKTITFDLLPRLPAYECFYSVVATAAAILHCHQSPASPAFQHGQKTIISPGILWAFDTFDFWDIQPHGLSCVFSHSKMQNSISGLAGWTVKATLLSILWNVCLFCWFLPHENLCWYCACISHYSVAVTEHLKESTKSGQTHCGSELQSMIWQNRSRMVVVRESSMGHGR